MKEFIGFLEKLWKAEKNDILTTQKKQTLTF